MELKSLIVGIILAVSIFAVKSGIGIYYIATHQSEWKGRVLTFLGSALSYGLLFIAAFLFLKWLNQVSLFPIFNRILKFGMPIHFALAFGMLGWAMYLLKRPESHRVSKAFLTLIVPCPVCMTVVVLITAFVMAYFPKHGELALLGVYGLYVVIQGLTLAAFTAWQRLSHTEPDRALGWGMLLIAGYFILTVLMAPQMEDLKKIYRIATYKGDTEMLKLNWTLTVWSIVLVTFAMGWVIRMWRLKRSR